MSRWKPNARARLVDAAVDLFAENGYDSVTVSEITQRAGLTKRTFFRHFADKREVLFSGQDDLGTSLVDAITGAPATATPLTAVGAGLKAFATQFGEARRDFFIKRQAIIRANVDLRERELFKEAALTATMTRALGARGLEIPNARLAAHIGALALGAAYEDWLDPHNRLPLADLTEIALQELSTAGAALCARDAISSS